MPSRYIQPLRILIQFCFLLFTLWLGFRFYQFVSSVRAGITPLVARPDGIEAFLPISGLMGAAAWFKGMGINPVHPAAVVIFITVLLISFLLRRSFCSWICPIATLSECSWKVGFKGLKRNLHLPKWLDITLRGVKYLLMAFFIYSILITMPPIALKNFILSDYHKIADVRLLDFFTNISAFALTIILILLATSIILRNPFCRYFCPYGALLGLAAMLSPLRITRNAERCVSCGVCTQVCPTYIDVMHKNSVNSPECIGCLRCMSHCRVDDTLAMRAVGKFLLSGILFAILVVTLFIGGTIAGKVTGHWHTYLDYTEYQRLLSKP